MVDQLPVASEDKDVLIAHPGMEVVAPALFLKRVPVVADATGAVLNALDHEHQSHTPFPGSSFPAPVHHIGRDERSVDKLQVPLTG